MLTEKNRERRLRRALNKAGYSLHKSRYSIYGDYLGGYMIVDVCGNYVVAGSRYDLDLDDVETWLKE